MLKRSGVIFTRKPTLRKKFFSTLSIISALIIVLLASHQVLSPASKASAWYNTNYQQHMYQGVSIQNMMFTPFQITIPVGGIVTFYNYDTMAHTTTSDTNLWDSGVLQPGQSIAYRFNTPGVYNYHCRIHPNMHGQIVVTHNVAMYGTPNNSVYGSEYDGYTPPSSSAQMYGFATNGFVPGYYAPNTYVNTNVYYGNGSYYSNPRNSYPVGTYPDVNNTNVNIYALNPLPHNSNPTDDGHMNHSFSPPSHSTNSDYNNDAENHNENMEHINY